MALTRQQRIFATTLARHTGLSPRVIGAWALAEESGGAAQARAAQRNNNWLNIGYTDSGPIGITRSHAFRDPRSAAVQTARFLKGEWGGASSGIRGILRSSGRPASEQIKAIAGSGWASSGYSGGNTLRQLYHQTGSEGLSDASGAPGGGGTGTPSLSVILRQGNGTTAPAPPDLTAVNMLAQGLQRPSPPPLGAVPQPSFSAQAPMPQGAQPLPPAGPPQVPQQTIDDQLQAVSQIVGVQPQQQPQLDVVSTPGPDGRPAPAHLHEKGVSHFDGKPVAKWIVPWLDYARKHGWKGSVNSGYRSVAEQARIYNSGVRPAAKPGQSNHNFTAFPGGAVDVTQAAQLAQILKRAHSPLIWAGAKDSVHFSHPHGGGY